MHARLLFSILLSACGAAQPVSSAAQRSERAHDAVLGRVASRERCADGVGELGERYQRALVRADDPSAPEPARIRAANIVPLTECYVARASLAVLELLIAMRADARAWPALRRALDWRQDATEEHAIRAARAIAEVPGIDAAQATAALASALARVRGDRSVDNRLRIYLIRAMGTLAHPDAVPPLIAIAEQSPQRDSFVIRRLALQELVEIHDPRALPVFVRALFSFAPDAPRLRTNDVAALGLVRLGRPSLAPMLALLRGENAEANGIAARYLEAVRVLDSEAARMMQVDGIVAGEACYVLGQLGMPEAFDVLMAESRRPEPMRRVSAVTAAVILPAPPSRGPQLRAAIERVLHASRDPIEQLQLLVAATHTYDPAILPFLLAPVRDARGPRDNQLFGARGYAMLANRSEVGALRRAITRQPLGELRSELDSLAPILGAAERCNEELSCWIAALADEDALLARKAVTMLARLGAGSTEVLAALIGRIDHPEPLVRQDALYAIDRLAVSGSVEAVRAIDSLRELEENRSSWAQIESLALTVRARLLLRAGS